ncbi:heterokaryon incompatibility protein-domain-containing protein [Stachybotrys elegans]|uniref:Heterokaryon incompatibility protein-domain-containing protein n=1 Tax=Stachybotrys elegans TaxID=80388 RepID=A0A8K0WT86_9HYPO|nr:heterokaryon incompatibility protein-domain-containing protein [Stachybotrys elegans]
MTSANRYVHEPLQSPSCIRVLDLVPSPSQAAEIKCSVRQVILGSSQAKYEALSYVWGARKGTLPILCDGKQLLVTPNCLDALKQLRPRFGTRTVWIDAICIDQDDSPASTAERNAQVKRMGDIYRGAWQVIVWLGNDGNMRIWRSLKLLAASRLAEMVADDLPRRVRKVVYNVTGQVKNAVQVRGLKYSDRLSDARYSELLQLLENPWFVRAWTTQEVAFARRCIVMCGSAVMHWAEFTFAIKKAHSLHNSTINTQMISFKDSIRHEIQHAGTEEEDSHEYRRMHDIQLLKAMCRLQSSVASDKVYGLYSVFAARGTRLPDADYDKPSANVIEEFAKAYTLSRRQLDLLRITLPAAEDKHVPSWLPDWFEGIAVGELTCCDTTGTRAICFDDYPSVVSACRQATAWPYLSPEPGKLGVKGKHVGTIKSRVAAVPINAANVDDFALFGDFMRTCQEWCVMFSNQTSYPTDEGAYLAGLRTIVSHKGYASPDIRPEDLHFWYESMLQKETGAGMLSGVVSAGTTQDIVSLISSGNYYSKGKDEPLNDGGRLQKVQRFINYKANYSSLVLDTGYFGSAHHTCREGDIIYVLAGLDVPCVLRKVEAEFRFVALAYIHGAMKGELWPVDEDDLEYIVLV